MSNKTARATLAGLALGIAASIGMVAHTLSVQLERTAAIHCAAGASAWCRDYQASRQ